VTTIAEGIGRINLVDAKVEWPDYAYDELLNMVFDIMREKNPDCMSGAKKTLTMKPPNVARAGSKVSLG
jgi:translation initiation factor 2 subunit 2